MVRGRGRGSCRSREEESNITARYCHVTAQHLMVPVCYKQSNIDLKVVVTQAEEKGLMKERHSLTWKFCAHLACSSTSSVSQGEFDYLQSQRVAANPLEPAARACH